MDGHILEQASSALDVGEGGRGGVTGLEDGADGLAHAALGDRLVEAGEGRVETTLEGRHELDACLICDLEGGREGGRAGGGKGGKEKQIRRVKRGWMDGGMDIWRDGWMEGWMDGGRGEGIIGKEVTCEEAF